MNHTLDERYTVLHWNSANTRENMYYSKDLVNFEILRQEVVQYFTYM